MADDMGTGRHPIPGLLLHSDHEAQQQILPPTCTGPAWSPPKGPPAADGAWSSLQSTPPGVGIETTRNTGKSHAVKHLRMSTPEAVFRDWGGLRKLYYFKECSVSTAQPRAAGRHTARQNLPTSKSSPPRPRRWRCGATENRKQLFLELGFLAAPPSAHRDCVPPCWAPVTTILKQGASKEHKNWESCAF